MGRTQRARITLERLVFSDTRACLTVDDAGIPDVSALEPMLSDCLDIQMVDAIGAMLTRLPQWEAHPRLRRVHAQGLTDVAAYDKWIYSHIARRSGVTIPETFSIAEAPTNGPLVLKGRIGSGGDRVRIVRNSSEIAKVLRSWGISENEAFVQRVVHGPLWNVGGVALAGEVLVAAAYRAIAAPSDPEGPPVDIELQDKPDQLEATRTFVAALGYSGPFAIDFIDDEGPYLLDFNPRFFGTWAAMQSAGVDLLGAYLHTLGGRATRDYSAAGAALVPASLTGQNSPGQALRRTVVLTRRLAPVVGARGAAVMAVSGLAEARKARHTARATQPSPTRRPG